MASSTALRPVSAGGSCATASRGSSARRLKCRRSAAFEQSLKFFEHVEIELALERHDEADELVARHPFPRIELGVMGVELDVGVAPQEAHREPFLHLAAIAPAPSLEMKLAGQLVSEPLLGLGEDLGTVGADLFLQFAQRRHARLLVLVDAALRHLL